MFRKNKIAFKMFHPNLQSDFISKKSTIFMGIFECFLYVFYLLIIVYYSVREYCNILKGLPT